jgi:DtxR family transcriptional regulator, Mn-dependent transcriptional regulator
MTSGRLAARLGLAPSSVTGMVKKLAAQGLVDHEPYGAVRLTDRGLAEALRMVRRHRLVETWLVREYGYGWDEVHDEAEVLEHALSDRMIEAIDARLGRPARDPHGDPIPTADGRVERPDAVLLADVATGSTGRVARISDRDGDVLRALADAGVDLDARVVAGQLPAELAAAVWVVLDRAG